MSFDPAEHRRLMFKHCLWLASRDQAYAITAADEYERKGEGVLNGLGAKVREAIERARVERAKEAADAAS